MKRVRCSLKRFVPPWETDGKTAEEFFGGLFSGNNPAQRQRKQQRKSQELDDALEHQHAMAEADNRARQEALNEHMQKLIEEEALARDFLPYGAQPSKYFDSTKMAAWGYYLSAVDGAGDQYSSQTKELLKNDAHTKIPYRYDSLPPLVKQSGGTPLWPLHGTAGVVLDIDGVVYRTGQIIDGSDEAIRKMIELKIPFLFMTNGGGRTEEKRAAELSEILRCNILPEQIIMSHTPMQLMAERYRDELVLIVGNPECVAVANRYGFNKAKSMLQFQAEHPELIPLKRWLPGCDVVKPLPPLSVPYPPISAIFQFSDCYDAYHDIQIIVDVLTSPFGQIGNAVSAVQTTPFFFAADDLIWSTNAPLPRLGGGAFREMLSSVYESVTGRNMHVTHFGKPRAIAYAFAEKRLKEISSGLGWDPANMRMIAMVGDNLETDIIGANARGAPWMSVHVLSGVGSAPAAKRTLSENDFEMEWHSTSVQKAPQYIAPTLDHFFRELLAFPEDVIRQNQQSNYGPLCPIDLEGVYNFKK